jgi:hypothetical protein
VAPFLHSSSGNVPRSTCTAALCLFAVFAASLSFLSADTVPGDVDWPESYPAWWHDAADPAAGVIDATRPVLNDENEALLNQGQLWNITRQGIAELDRTLAPVGGAGFTLDTFRDPSGDPSHYAPAALGHLKNVGSRFFQRFSEVGFGPGDPGWPSTLILDQGPGDKATEYPWLDNQSPLNLEPANTGQAKQTFSWDLRPWIAEDSENDGTGDGLPDWWEQFHFGNLEQSPQSDADADSLPDLLEYIRGSDPSNSDQDGDERLDGAPVSGKVAMEQWTLKKSKRHDIRYIDSRPPEEIIWLDALTHDAGPVTYENHFGRRIRGYITPPASGEYRFWIHGNDYVQLWLSADASTDRARRIAFNYWSNFRRAYRQYSGQVSFPIELVAGENYYFELFHQGDVHKDYFGVAWTHAGARSPQIIGGEALRSFVYDPTDLDGDNLDDALEETVGLDPLSGTGSNGRFGDTDADGFENAWEARKGTHPLQANPFPARSRQDLFPELDDPDTHSLDHNWSIHLAGKHYQTEAFSHDSTLYLASCGDGEDAYQFVYQAVEEPFRLTTKVAYTAMDDTRAKAGLLFRTSLEEDAFYYWLSLAPDGRVTARSKISPHAPEYTRNNGLLTFDPEVWLRLEWDGRHITALYSFNGQDWIEYEQLLMNGGSDSRLGFATSSNDALEVVAAAFSDSTIEFDSVDDPLWDSEEAAPGTGSDTTDSDGDGVSDYEEVRERLSDPLDPKDGVRRGTTVQPIREASQTLGIWSLNERGELESRDIAGKLAIPFSLAQSRIYELGLPVRFRYSTTENRDPECVIHHYIDGEYLKTTRQLPTGKDSTETLWLLLPYLRSGDHVYSLHWENVYEGRKISLGDVSIAQPTSLSGEALQDWQKQYIDSTEEVIGLEASQDSQVSPFYVEGRSRFVGMVEIGEGSSVYRGSGDTWFAHVDLPTDGSAKDFSVQFQQGGKTVEASASWATTDVLAGGSMELRSGDSLRLVAGSSSGEGEGDYATITVGEASYVAPAGSPVVHKFEHPGDYLIEASVDGRSGQMALRVHDSGWTADPPALFRDRFRRWTWEGIGESLVVDSASSPVFGASPSAAGSVLLLQRHEVVSPQHLAARIGTDGPILLTVPTEGFWVRENVEGYYVSREVEEGVIEGTNKLICSELPEDVRLQVEIFKAGVTFVDGTIEKWLTAEDLDAFGRCDLVMLKPEDLLGSVCHQISVYEGEDFICRR